MEPRKVIGSIDTSEFIVAVAASGGFLIGLGSQGIDLTWVAGLLIGGVVAAPLAAWVVRLVPARVLGSAVGGMIILTNTRTILRSDWLNVAGSVRVVAYLVIVLVWAAALAFSIREYLAERAALELEQSLAR
jgi:uncharacterized protein